MKKIPTLFQRSDDRRHVIDKVTPGCEWVLAGEGVATRKYDGTCVMFDGERWWARREVKPGKNAPPQFVEVEHDDTTGKTVGWAPYETSSFAQFLDEAVARWDEPPPIGTWELVGPKINGNPEHSETHAIVLHGVIKLDGRWGEGTDAPRTFDALRDWLLAHDYEGIVWHHPDGRMAKLKRRDFPASSVEVAPPGDF